MVESAEGKSLLVFVGTAGNGDIPLAVRIEVDRVEACQSGCSCTYLADFPVQTPDVLRILRDIRRIDSNVVFIGVDLIEDVFLD